MNRRTFLTKATASVGIGALAGCSGGNSDKLRVVSKSGFEESNIFADYEYEYVDSHIYLTEEASLEYNIDEIESSTHCGEKNAGGPVVSEYEVEPAQTDISLNGQCAGKYVFVAYDNVDNVKDDVTVVLEKVES